MSFAPLHYRKLRIAEHGAFALLPLYVRCFGEGLKKLCDDRGRIVLDGRTPADVIARRGGAETNERRRIAADVIELLRVGWLREDGDALVVVEQEQDWEQLDSSRALNMRPSSSRRASERRPSSSRLASDLRRDVDRMDSSTRNDSADPLASDQIYKNKQKKREEEKEKRGECEGGQAPRTDPTPTLRRQKLDEAIAKEAQSSGRQSFDPAFDAEKQDAEDLEGQSHPTPSMRAPFPPSPRQVAFVAVVDPKPVPKSEARLSVPYGATVPLVDLGPSGKAKKAPAKKATLAKQGADIHGATRLPEDWKPTEAHYAYGEQLGMQRKHVDYFADEMRDTRAADGKTSGNWDASFRNWLRKGLEFRKGSLPFVPDPPAPKRSVPPPPPLHPMVAEEARKFGELMDQNPHMNLRELLDFEKAGKTHCFDDMADA